MTHPNDGPAFPGPLPSIDTGLSMRDWFAGQTLSGIINAALAMTDPTNEGMSEFRIQRSAALAYAIADAMLKERAKT